MNKSYLQNFSDEQMTKITSLVKEIEKLSDIEKLLLYLHLPEGTPNDTEIKPSKNKSSSDLFGKKADQEITQTYTWIISHLEEDSNVSLPKQEVYDEYRAFCEAHRFEPLCVADFGKAMKHAFPRVKPRRLGQRGNSRYCYSGLRKKYNLQPPSLPTLIEPTFCIANDCSQAVDQIINECEDNPERCTLISANDPTLDAYQDPNTFIKSEQVLSEQPQAQYSGAKENPVLSNQQSIDPSISMSSGFDLRRCPSQLPCTPDDDDYHHHYQFEQIRQQQRFTNPNNENNHSTRYNFDKVNLSYGVQQAMDDINTPMNTNDTIGVNGNVLSVENNHNNTTNSFINTSQEDTNFKQQAKKNSSLKRSMFSQGANDITHELLIPTKKMYIKSKFVQSQNLKNEPNISEQSREVQFSTNNETDRHPNASYEVNHALADDGYRLAELREMLEKNLPHSQSQAQSIHKGQSGTIQSQTSRQQNFGSTSCQKVVEETTPSQQSSNMQLFNTSLSNDTDIMLPRDNFNQSIGVNQGRYMNNNLAGQALDNLRFVHHDDVSQAPEHSAISSSINQEQMFPMSHTQMIHDSPLNSNYSTPPERISLGNNIHSHYQTQRCSQIDASMLNQQQIAIYRQQEEQGYNALAQNEYQNLGSGRHMMNLTSSYEPTMDVIDYQRSQHSNHRQHTHHQHLCHSPFVSPSSTPFIENYDQSDDFHMTMFND